VDVTLDEPDRQVLRRRLAARHLDGVPHHVDADRVPSVSGQKQRVAPGTAAQVEGTSRRQLVRPVDKLDQSMIGHIRRPRAKAKPVRQVARRPQRRIQHGLNSLAWRFTDQAPTSTAPSRLQPGSSNARNHSPQRNFDVLVTEKLSCVTTMVGQRHPLLLTAGQPGGSQIEHAVHPDGC
jgi:hypothetical protein